MKNKSIRIKFTLLLCLLFLISISGVYALEKGYCVGVHVTDINPSSVGPNEEVIVSIQFDNCGEKLPTIIKFELKRFSSDISISEPLITNIDNFGYANSDRFKLYHLYVTKNASPGEYLFEYKLSYGDEKFLIVKEGDFSIMVTSDEADLDIAYVKTDPIIPEAGEEMTLTIRIENFGDGDANSVKAKVDLPFLGIKEAFLGEIEADDDSPAVFTLIPNKSGEFDYSLVISYKDDYGKHYITENLKLYVKGDGKNGTLEMGIIIAVLIASASLGSYFYFKRKKKK